VTIGAAGLALAASACGVTSSSSTDTADSSKPLSDLRIMVPNSPGGGYDITARTAAKVMEQEKITSGTEVFNLEGAGGTVGLARTVNEKGNADLTMLMGLGVVGASYTAKSKATLAQTTPIVRLIEEYGAVMVPKKSPYKTINDLVKAWKSNPGSVSIGGGSSPGGPDHLLPMQLAQTVGIDPARSTSCSTTAVATCSRRSSATRSTWPPPASASSRTRSPTVTSGSSRSVATSGWPV